MSSKNLIFFDFLGLHPPKSGVKWRRMGSFLRKAAVRLAWDAFLRTIYSGMIIGIPLCIAGCGFLLGCIVGIVEGSWIPVWLVPLTLFVVAHTALAVFGAFRPFYCNEPKTPVREAFFDRIQKVHAVFCLLYPVLFFSLVLTFAYLYFH